LAKDEISKVIAIVNKSRVMAKPNTPETPFPTSTPTPTNTSDSDLVAMLASFIHDSSLFDTNSYYKSATDFMNNGLYVIEPADTMDVSDELDTLATARFKDGLADAVLIATKTRGVKKSTPGAPDESSKALQLTKDELTLRTARLERWWTEIEHEKKKALEQEKVAKELSGSEIQTTEEKEEPYGADSKWTALLENWKLFREQVAVEGEQYEWATFDKIA
jgi:hypothetical protein